MTTETAVPAPVLSSRIPLAPISVAIPAIIFGVTAISLPLAAAEAFGLSTAQTTAMIAALYGIPAVLCLVLTILYRQPLLIAWHTGGLIFVTSAARSYTYTDVLGAMVVAGVLVLLIGVLGLSSRMAALVPAPIVFGIVAGSIMPFVVQVFTSVTTDRTIVGSTVMAYVLGRRFLSARIPPLLPALVGGSLVAALVGEINRLPGGWSVPTVTGTMPSFSWQAVLSIAPVVAIFIAVQSNLTTVIYLRSQQYQPPDRLMNVVTGSGTMLGSFFGITPISTGSSVIPLVAGPEAGDHQHRHWAVYLCGGAWLMVALFASVAADIPRIVPLSLLLALAGLALVGVLQQALREITKGPLRLGPLFAFVVASSQMTLLGFGPLFWALVIGMALTLLLEQTELAALRSPVTATT